MRGPRGKYHMKKSPEQRFWEKVDRRGEDECWPWKAHRDDFGYGTIYIGKHERSHRATWMFCRGPIPEGMCVCHRCDNPWCCNPNHLLVATKGDNNRDMFQKGRDRLPKGEEVFCAKLKATDIPQIRFRLKCGDTLAEVASVFSVHPCTISDVKQGRSWTHIP